MTVHNVQCRPNRARIAGLPVSITIMCQLLATPAVALDWEIDDVYVRFDTTLSQGVTVRTSERDADIIGIANGGTAY